MAKTTTRFVCQSCGAVAPRWMGRCAECGEWNSLIEEVSRATPNTLTARIQQGTPTTGNMSYMGAAQSGPRPITQIQAIEHERSTTFIPEFDRVLGGGVVPGSLILIGGDPGIGKCLAGSERVLDPVTGDYLPITQWANQLSPVLSLTESNYRLAPAQPAAFLDNGEQEVVEVRTRLGRTLRCTPTHPVLTPEGWQPVSALQPGSRIASPRALPFFGSESMDDNVVKLIAYILSDGSAQSQISITTAIPEVERDIEGLAAHFGMTLRVYTKPNNLAKQFRLVMPREERFAARQEFASAIQSVKERYKISYTEWSKQAEIPFPRFYEWTLGNAMPSVEDLQRLANAIGIPLSELAPEACDRGRMKTPVARLLEDFGLRYATAANKHVPEFIFRLPKAKMALFLKTLFTCDGSVYSGNMEGVSYSTISHQLAKDIQHLLLRFGFITKLRTKAQKVNGQPYTAYELQMLGIEQVKRFLCEIGIEGREVAKAHISQQPVPTLTSTQSDTIPTEGGFWDAYREATNGESREKVKAQTGVVLYPRRPGQPVSRRTVASVAKIFHHPLLNKLAFGDVYWDEIETISPAGREQVFDLSVPESANFVANDLIVHNSTLLTKFAGNVAAGHGITLYVSGEESVEQIKMRAARLEAEHDNLLLASETDVAQIASYVDQLKPKFIIIDSIQTMQSPDVDSTPGTVSQVRASTAALAAIAKGKKIPIFLVGHVTKEGSIAGPRVLEHMVDTVLYFEGDQHVSFRILRAVKNRFGSTDELGIFEMREEGLVGVENPSEMFLAERPVLTPGSTVTATIEGTRPILVEIQALVAPSYLGSPRRMTNGVSRDRVSLILAVLEKRVGLSLANQDVYVNVAGGVRIEEPAIDLAIALAVASNFKEMPVDPKAIFLGEIGLAGEVRGCSQMEKRLKEAARLGFDTGLIPKKNMGRDAKNSGMAILSVDSVRAAVDRALITPSNERSDE